VSVVRLEAVTVDYGRGRAVGPVTVDVGAGRWLCLIGPNGAGKTSLLHAVSGLVAYGGSVSVDGTPLARLRPAARARLVALVPQQPTVPDGLSVTDYVLLGRNPHIPRFGIESATDRAVVAAALDRLELTAFANRHLTTLSGGELQRVLLARALAQQTPVLLLDEPTSALDLGHQQQVLRLVDELRLDYGLTVLTSMHDLTLAGAFADSLLLLDRGDPVAVGRPAEVLTEAILARYYRADVQVVTAPDGTIAVVPTLARRPRPAGEQRADGLGARP